MHMRNMKNMYIYSCIYICICPGCQWPLPPPPHGNGPPGDAPPPPVGCGVDRGDAHRIHRGRAPHMVMPPPPVGCGVEVHMG